VVALDACGTPVLSPTSVVTSKGFITVALTATINTGNAISVINANGDTCIKDDPNPEFEGYVAQIDFCGVDPDLFHIVSGMPLVTDSQATPQNVGFRQNSDVDVSLSGFALEMWSDVPGQVCAVAGQKSYGYMLLPFLKGGVIGDFTVGNDAVNFSLTGAATKTGSGWGVGPFNVTRNLTNVAVPLKTAILSGDHLHLELVTVNPPTAVCGATALGVPATSIVAGIPATSLPANSYMPANLAGAVGITASPATAWTTGQYALLRDGTTMHWSSSAWVAGPA
jgi:hypothetical protein